MLLRSGKFSLCNLALLFFPLLFLGLLIGHHFPAPILSKDVWISLTLLYCFCAAVLPVGVLLQPRDFLSAGFLYAILALGALGMLVAGESLQLPVFLGWESEKLGMLIPFFLLLLRVEHAVDFIALLPAELLPNRFVRRVILGELPMGRCYWRVY